MCNPASFVLTENEAYWSKMSDGHSDIIEEHKLREGRAGKIEILACEISPPKGADDLPDYRLPLDKWLYRVDDTYPIPSWYNAERDEARARMALPMWVAEKIVLAPVAEVKAGFKVAAYANIGLLNGGTVQSVLSGGTVRRVENGGTVQRVENGGTVQRVWNGGTVISFSASVTAAVRLVMTGVGSILVDRSTEKPVCYVGPQKPERKPKSSKKKGVK